MAFRFRYERVLKLREDEEQDKKHALAAAQRRRDAAQGALEQLRSDKSDFDQTRSQRIAEGLKASELQWFSKSEQWFLEAIEAAQAVVRQAELEVINARVALVKAAQEKKKFEKLKEIAENQQREEEAYKEAQLVDSLVTYQSTKKQGGYEG